VILVFLRDQEKNSRKFWKNLKNNILKVIFALKNSHFGNFLVKNCLQSIFRVKKRFVLGIIF